jgi:hypothetical protein
MNRRNGSQLRRAQRAPAQRVDDVVLQGGVQLLELAHSSMSSTERTGRSPLGGTDISVSASVSA